MLTHHFPPVRIAPRYTVALLVLCTLALLFFSSTANRVAAFFLFWHGVRIVHDVLHTGRLWPYAWPRALLDMRGILRHKWLVFFAVCAAFLVSARAGWTIHPYFLLQFAFASAFEDISPSPQNDE